MTARRYLQLDVFSRRAGAGNPLGVVLDADGLDTQAMQALAAWLDLSETVFFLAPTTSAADYRIRIFTPRSELPFAGHPSVGAAWAALETGRTPFDATTLVQECGAGLLAVKIEPGPPRVIRVRSPRAQPVQVPVPQVAPLLARVLAGMALGRHPPALWNNGPSWWLVELADVATVRAAQPDLPAIEALTRATGAIGLAVFAAAPGSSGPGGHDLVVRAFCPGDGVAEDPVTGSANACIGALLHASGGLPGDRNGYRVSQGREVGRDGQVQVQVDSNGAVWIGGQVHRVISGQVHW